jgi:hypothetical protein
MEDRLFHPPSSWTRRLDLAAVSVGRNGVRHLCDGWIGNGPCNHRSGADGGAEHHSFLDHQRNQRALQLPCDRVRRAMALSGEPGADASKIPFSQSSIPFLSGTVLIPTNPAPFSHFAVSEAG